MPPPWVIPTAITAGASLASGALGKKKTKQGPLVPDEVIAAMQRLNEFGRTGQFGDFKAGAEVPLGYGDFGMTDVEKRATSGLGDLLSSGIPDQFRLGDEALRDLLATSPQQIESMFEPFKAQTQRTLRESEDALKRSAGFAGNLYSTNTIRGLGDIQARGNETLTSELARLTNEALNRRERAIPLAFQSAESQEGIRQNRLGSAFNFGGLARQLNDASIKSRDAELLRRRNELQLPIEATKSVTGFSPSYGVPEIETSPFDDILGLVGQIGGTYAGNELALSQYQRRFPGQPFVPPTPVVSPYNYGSRVRL